MKSLKILAAFAVISLVSSKFTAAQPGPGASIPGTVGFTLKFDEAGNALLNGNPYAGVPVLGGGVNFQLPGPVIPGFVLFGNSVDVDPNNPGGDSDLLIFTNIVLASGQTVGQMTYESLLDPNDPLMAADVPFLNYPQPIIFNPEVGPEGNNGFTWVPDPLNNAGATYIGISDGVLVPEPSTFALGGLGLAFMAAAAYRRRGHKACSPAETVSSDVTASRNSSHAISTLIALCVVALLVAPATQVSADPLSGEVLKFQQLPLNNGLPPTPNGAPYPGHDEWSTADLFVPGNGYVGTFMADDFSDTVSTSVYHVSWWGSYDQNLSFNGVQKFLVSFESDLPYDPTINGSRPDQVLSSEVVTLGNLTPGSGTFTEKLVNGNVPEHLYQYNAELKVPFPELANQVYWLKIVALVDPTTEGNINWGWHDRDWSLQNTLASPVPNPGEHVVGTVVDPNGTPQNVWHFQDDAVAGRILMTPNSAGGFGIQQFGYQPQNYIYTLGAIPIDGPVGIQNFSKDLAFELYTRVPEPSTYTLLATGAVGLLWGAWRKRRAA